MTSHTQKRRLERHRRERSEKAQPMERKPQKGRHVPDDRRTAGGSRRSSGS
jgi:hypothetical protein